MNYTPTLLETKQLRSESLLGKIAKSKAVSADGLPDVIKLAQMRRYELLHGAQALLPGERVGGCQRFMVYGRECVDLFYLPEMGRAKFAGLQTCSSVWMCPVCAAKISERRKHELEQLLAWCDSQKYIVLFLTYTIRHDQHDSLPALIEGMNQARSALTGDWRGRKLLASVGYVGSVRAKEITYGANGWHPHMHEIVILKADTHLGMFIRNRRVQWERVIERAGLKSVNEHGFRWQLADSAITEYLAKFGHERSWNVEHELTKQVSKKGKTESRTPVDLLSAYVDDGDYDAGCLYQEYAHAMKGQRQLFWSPGLKKLSGVQEFTDEQLAEQSEHVGVLMGQFDRPAWRVIRENRAQAQVLNVASTGDWLQVVAYLDTLKPAQDESTIDVVDQVEDMLHEFRAGAEQFVLRYVNRFPDNGLEGSNDDDPFADELMSQHQKKSICQKQGQPDFEHEGEGAHRVQKITHSQSHRL